MSEKPQQIQSIIERNFEAAEALGLSGLIDDLRTVLPGDFAHSVRVGVGAYLLARAATSNPEVALAAGVSGLVHDVGKADEQVASLVSRNCRLTAEERLVVGMHPAIGFNMISAVYAGRGFPEEERNLYQQVGWSTLLHHQSAVVMAGFSQHNPDLLVPALICVVDPVDARYDPDRVRYTGEIIVPDDDVKDGSVDAGLFLNSSRDTQGRQREVSGHSLSQVIGNITVKQGFELVHANWDVVMEGSLVGAGR